MLVNKYVKQKNNIDSKKNLTLILKLKQAKVEFLI